MSSADAAPGPQQHRSGIPATEAELRRLDALFADRQGDWWDRFYADRTRPVPFFGEAPDESLEEWLAEGLLTPGAALDIGCGNGRNALRLARAGFAVEGLDLSATALQWAAEGARRSGLALALTRASVFDHPLPPDHFALVCDSGCFHHLPPHRRPGYVDRVVRALRPGGCLAMVCFAPEGGSGLSDAQVYEQGSLGGGLGYSEAQLRAHWQGPLQIERLRRMRTQAAGSALFGRDFLWGMLARKP